MAFNFLDSRTVVADVKGRLFAYPEDKKNYNATVLNAIHDQYLYCVGLAGYALPVFKGGSIDSKIGIWESSGYKLINFISSKLGLRKTVVDQTLRAIFDLAKKGKIEKAKYDPSFSNIVSKVGNLQSEKSFFDNVMPKAGKVGKVIAVVAVLGISAFILHDITKLKRG